MRSFSCSHRVIENKKNYFKIRHSFDKFITDLLYIGIKEIIKQYIKKTSYKYYIIMENSNSTQIDVLLITALKDELDVVFEAEADWQPKEDSKGFRYYIRKDIDNSGNEFVIAAARPIGMGGDFASNLATRLVNELKPFCLAMVGICAGWRDYVFLGDVIIAERVFRYDAGKLKVFLEGKVRTEQVFQDIQTYDLKPLWVQKAQDFPSDWIEKISKKNPRPKSYNYQELWLLYKLDEFEIVGGEYPLKLKEKERKKTLSRLVKSLGAPRK